DEVAELARLARPARPAHDAGDDAVSPRVIGDADHRDLGDRSVLAEDLFDLQRAELVAPALPDGDARTAKDPEGPARQGRIARDGVARSEPSAAFRVVDEGGLRLLRPLVIAGEDAWSPDPELAGVGIAAVVADDARLDGRERETDR